MTSVHPRIEAYEQGELFDEPAAAPVAPDINVSPVAAIVEVSPVSPFAEKHSHSNRRGLRVTAATVAVSLVAGIGGVVGLKVIQGDEAYQDPQPAQTDRESNPAAEAERASAIAASQLPQIDQEILQATGGRSILIVAPRSEHLKVMTSKPPTSSVSVAILPLEHLISTK